VTFDPAFSGTPDICFGAFGSTNSFDGKDNIDFISKSVKPTHVDFQFGPQLSASYFKIGLQWMACGHSNRGMTAEMLLDLKLNE